MKRQIIHNPLDANETSSWILRGIFGIFKDREFVLGKTTLIGRNPNADIVFPPDTAGISRMQCVLTEENGEIYIEDLHSTCGTKLDLGIFYPIPVKPGQQEKLEEGTYICLAPIRNSVPESYRQIFELRRVEHS